MKYQEKVATRADVRNLYERVKQNPSISHYRGYTLTKFYGWDEECDDYIKADGDVWFENPCFVLKDSQIAEARAKTIDEFEERLKAIWQVMEDGEYTDYTRQIRSIVVDSIETVAKSMREKLDEGN